MLILLGSDLREAEEHQMQAEVQAAVSQAPLQSGEQRQEAGLLDRKAH